MARTLVLRCDADPQIGSGHVMRCLALAQAWRRAGGEAVLCTAPLPQPIQEKLRRERIPTFGVRNSHDQAKDVAETLACARERDAEWVVVDGTSLGPRYAASVQEAGLRTLLWMDGGSAEEIDADLILDQNIGARLEDYPNAKATMLLGTRYACLREEFLEPRPDTERRSLLVTFGGAPPRGAVEMAITAIRSLSLTDVKVVLAGGHSAIVGLDVPPGIDVLSGTDDLAVVMDRSLVAISAAGTTCWELCHLGVPQVLFALSDDQAENARGLEQAGCAFNLDRPSSNQGSALAGALERLLADPSARIAMGERGRRLVDGRGADRVVSAIEGKK